MTDAPWHHDPMPLIVHRASRFWPVLAVAATVALAAYTHHRLNELQQVISHPAGASPATPNEFMGFVLAELDLSDGQAAAIQDIWQREAPSLELLRESVASLGLALAEAAESQPFNEAVAGDLVRQRATATAFLWGKEAYVVSSVLSELDDEQRAEFRRHRSDLNPIFEPEL